MLGVKRVFQKYKAGSAKMTNLIKPIGMNCCHSSGLSESEPSDAIAIDQLVIGGLKIYEFLIWQIFE
jgi:hypothetical protein